MKLELWEAHETFIKGTLFHQIPLCEITAIILRKTAGPALPHAVLRGGQCNLGNSPQQIRQLVHLAQYCYY